MCTTQPTPTTSTQLVPHIQVHLPAPLLQQLEQISLWTSGGFTREVHLPNPPANPLYYIIGWSVMPHPNAYNSTAPQLLRVASPYRGTCSNGEGGKTQKKKNKKIKTNNNNIYTSPVFPGLWGQRERNPPSYDSRVHGLTRLLRTSPPRSSPLPPPASPPVCLPVSLSSLVFFLFFLCLRAGRRQIQSDRVKTTKKITKQDNHTGKINYQVYQGTARSFFLSGCCMAQRRSLSGRSPFCQRKLSDSRKFKWKFCSLKATTLTKQKTQNTPNTMQSPRECREV